MFSIGTKPSQSLFSEYVHCYYYIENYNVIAYCYYRKLINLFLLVRIANKKAQTKRRLRKNTKICMGYVQCVHRTFDFAFVNHTINICCSFDRPISNDYELRISLVCLVYGVLSTWVNIQISDNKRCEYCSKEEQRNDYAYN